MKDKVALMEELAEVKTHLPENFRFTFSYNENNLIEGRVIDVEKVLQEYDDIVRDKYGNTIDSPYYANYKQILVNINKLVKRSAFENTLSLDDKSLEDQRQKDIGEYRRLVDKLEMPSRKKKLKPTSGTITFQNILENAETQPCLMPFYEIRFDNLYNLVSQIYISTSNKEEIDKDIDEQMITELKKEIEKLSKMTLEEYRQYRASRARLSEQELLEIKEEKLQAKQTVEANSQQVIPETQFIEPKTTLVVEPSDQRIAPVQVVAPIEQVTDQTTPVTQVIEQVPPTTQIPTVRPGGRLERLMQQQALAEQTALQNQAIPSPEAEAWYGKEQSGAHR